MDNKKGWKENKNIVDKMEKTDGKTTTDNAPTATDNNKATTGNGNQQAPEGGNNGKQQQNRIRLE